MATSEHVEDPMKDKVADPDEQIKDKNNEIKDVKNAGGAEDVITEAIAVEEDNKKNEAKTKETVVEKKGKQPHEAEEKKDELEKTEKDKGVIDEAVKVENNKNEEKPANVVVEYDGNEAPKKEKENDQVEKADASDRKIAVKSSSMEPKEKSEEAHKNKDVVEGVVKEEKKKIEAEPREIAVENKKQEADQTEKKKDEVEKNDTSELNKVEKSSTMTAKENVKEPQIVKEVVVNEDKKKISVEPIKEIVMENKGKQADETENKIDEDDKTDASKKMPSLATKEKLEDAQKDRGVVEEGVKEDKPKIEAESRETVVEIKGKQDDQVEKKKDEAEKVNVSKFTNDKKLEETKKDQSVTDGVVEEDKKKNELKPGELVVEAKGKEVDKTEKNTDEVKKVDASTHKMTGKSSSMETEEKLEETLKNKGGVEGVVKEENKIEAKPKEAVVENKEKEDDQTEKKKDEIQTTKEPQMDNVIVEEKVNEEKEKIDAKPSETVVENKGNEVDESRNKKDEVEKTIASKGTNVEKSSSTATEEKLGEAKKIEVEPKEIVVENKGKKDDKTENKKVEVEKTIASKGTNVEKSSSTATEEKLGEAKKIEVEPKEIVVENKGKKDDKTENKKVEVEKTDASKCTEVENSLSMATEEKLKETLKDMSTVEEVAKEDEKNIEAESIEIVVDNKVKGETVEEVSLKEEKEDDQVGNGGASKSGGVEKCVSLKEENTSMLELKEHEKKALAELRSKIEKAIHENKETSQEVDEAEAAKQEDEEKDKSEAKVHFSINEDVAIWGVPLLPSKDDNATDVILLKFLKAKDFEVNNAFEMLWNTLKWRKDNNIDWILDEDFSDDLSSIGIMNGVSREGHPVYYSSFKLFGNEESYNKVLGTEEKRNMFIRSRIQLMERAIMKLDFKSGGVSSIFLVNDCKDMPGPSKKELRNAIKQILTLHQDNYPEFVAKHIFINVPFWYYAFSASTFLSPFLTPKSNSKFVFARPAKVNEVLLKYIALEELPDQYGGFKRENDPDFGAEDVLTEISINQSSTEIIRIPIEAGVTIIWEVLVFGWEVTYKEEFSPENDGSSSVIIQKGRKISGQEGSIRNFFTSKEPGTIVLTIENGALIKKKRIYYRYKIKDHGTS